jgi:hypothetical protein
VSRLHLVDDGVPGETVALMREACAVRGVELVEVHARSFDFAPERQLGPGDLLYRPAVSLAAMRVEQFLFGDGVATFYRDADGPMFQATAGPLLHARAGIPTPRTIYCATTSREFLRGAVERLGGFPVIVKIMGFSGGQGVMLAESLPGLFSLVDHLVAQGSLPLLCAYVPDSIHWRVVVVGDRAVASYTNPVDADDFRTYASTDPADYPAEVRPALEDAAVRAVHALRVEHGGVDLLEHPSGRLYLLEANFPCYYPQAQRIGGIDVAGAMVDYLLEKAVRLTEAGPPGRTA